MDPDACLDRIKVAFIDRDEIHIAHHENWIASNFDRLRGNEPVLFEMLAHLEQHRITFLDVNLLCDGQRDAQGEAVAPFLNRCSHVDTLRLRV